MRFYLRALRYFRDDLPLIILSLLLIAFSTLANVVQPLLVAILITICVGQFDHTWGNRAFLFLSHILGFTGHPLRQVLLLAGLSVGLRVAQELLAMAQRLINVQIGYNGLMRVRCDLFQKLQQLSIGYHKSQPQGDAIYRLSYDATGFQTILTVFVSNVVVSLCTLLFMTVIMVQINWKLALITLSVAPLLLWVTQLFSEPLKKRWLEAKDVDTKLTTVIQRSVASIGLVQAFGREADEFAQFQTSVLNSNRANIRQAWQDSLYWLTVGTIFGLGYALIFGYGGWLILHSAFTVGALYPFLAYVNQVYAPLQAVSGSGASIQGGVAGAQRVFEVLDRDPVIKDAPDAIHLSRQSRTLTFDKVSFEYRSGEPVLRDIDVVIKPGQMVAFVGSSGVGKTTLLNLLPRFYDPVSGAIRLDQYDLRKIKIKDLRAHVALVLQDNLILPTTVAENIAYGRPQATAQEIRAAARFAGADAFIEKLADKYDAQISESGGNLSGGQRQRIGIARALLTEAPILVLDEPTSALDAQNESLVIETLNGLKKHRTIILVSHRLSTVADCDQIFVMDDGRIVESGRHEDLVARGGVYFAMARQQLKLQQPTAAG
jgi:ABC-type multidrug transport system fused ATPase/permease subunit